MKTLWSCIPLLVSVGVLGAAGPLPASPYPVRIDGDPREAFLLGALELTQADAISGDRDGSVRAFTLATRDGLYVAILSTERPETQLLLPPRAEGTPGVTERQTPVVEPPADAPRHEFLGPPVRVGDAPASERPPDTGRPEFLGPPVRVDADPKGKGVTPIVGTGFGGEGAPPSAGERRAVIPGRPVAPDAAVAGDWMAVRIQAARDAAFVLTPDGRTVSVGEDGRASGLPDLSWMAAGSRFGHTWAGEWLLPWRTLGLAPGQSFRISALRGRKVSFQGTALEVLSSSSPDQSPLRWGGEGLSLAVPTAFPPPIGAPRALRSYEVRPFVPASDAVPSCMDAAPAGEVATAWLEIPPAAGLRTIRVEGPKDGAEVFRVDYWWQAGTREEQDALFPVRVSAGAGDLLVAERLFPPGAAGLAPSPWPTRVYVRCRLPADAAVGTARWQVGIFDGARSLGTIPWRIQIAPALPRSKRMAGAYYSERDASRWATDLADMAAHGLLAVTSPAAGPTGTERFIREARAAGLDGTYILEASSAPPIPGAWAYVTDEPASEAAVQSARTKAAALKARGFKTWAALAWPISVTLAKDLDRTAFAPNLIDLAGSLGLTSGRWVYFQGLRENPLANRLSAGLLSSARGLTGFWVFCYAQGGEGDTDWSHPIFRHDVLVENGPGGTRIQTVQWEALREGILDARLREALGSRLASVDARFPPVSEVLAGHDWTLDRARWDAAAYRAALVNAWSEAP